MRIRSSFPVSPVLLSMLLLLATPGLALSPPPPPCDVEAPYDYGIGVNVTCNNEFCQEVNAPVTMEWELQPQAGGFFPPFDHFSGYEITACDTITWSFSDGSPNVVALGDPRVTHTWAAPGNYVLTATVQNALGEATIRRDFVVGPESTLHVDHETVAETAKSVTLTIRRRGDTTRRVTATFRVPVNLAELVQAVAPGTWDLVFEPGQTTMNIVLPLVDNQIYDGTRQLIYHIEDLTGGTRLEPYKGIVIITDDEPQPTLAAENLVVHEGDGGTTSFDFPVHLSAPVGGNLPAGVFWSPLTAHRSRIDILGSWLPAGNTSTALTVVITGDTTPEPDEVYGFGFDARGYPYAPLPGPPGTITIVNDDAGLIPATNTAEVGQRVPMILYPGQHFAAEKTVTIRTSGAAVTAPETLIIPVGASAIPFDVVLTGEGPALFEIDLGDRSVRAEVRTNQPRGITGAPSSLTITMHGTTRVTLGLAPAHDVPVTLQLTTDPNIVTVPRAITIPAGGEATFDVQAIGKGATAIAITPLSDAIGGVVIPIDVLPGKRRAAR
jgi:hypothetical protein